MHTWGRTLTTAGIHDPRLRDDYTRQRRLVSGYRRNAYIAVRLLLPPELAPHVIAATAFMHHTDLLADQPDGGDGFAAWEKEVRDGLAVGDSAHPVLRPLLHTASVHPGLREHAERFLAGAPMDRDFSGFADEAGYQRYVDAYSLPAFMLVACLVLSPDADADDSRALCRSYIDGSQRLDFVNDLAEDLGDGRLTLPEETLTRHEVSRSDLERKRDTPHCRALFRDLLEQSRRDLLAGRSLPELAPPAHRAFVRAFVALELLTNDAALAKGGRVLHESAGPSPRAALGVLIREYRRRGRR
ncbi:phytoene/squalene synthase family protein [Streptomyces hesseae]|uniref:Squalene/phytoene synthase family protein n=1 Tax=Streptomyces hesseae TaxID=3075519 RepID=A0ABU2SK74_9ACTN|nr:squalene/phytoene synthase family protein [Streptomyces sp. DSM 40473]MDT0449379.1 squalene/phytoene synthase family protein [Streptomyces sp. DSM 40473]